MGRKGWTKFGWFGKGWGAIGWDPAGGLIYLLYDEFTTPDPTPLTTPRTCEPGPGTLNIMDAAAQFSIANGKLTRASAAGYSTAVSTASVTRQAGLCVAARFASLAGAFAFVGLSNSALNAFAPTGEYVECDTDEFWGCAYDGGGYTIRTPTGLAAPYTSGFILRSALAAHHFINGKLAWVNKPQAGFSNDIYPGIACGLGAVYSYENFMVLSLPANGYAAWGADFSTITDSKTAPANGTTFNCAADHEAKITHTYETGTSVSFRIRYLNSTNCVIIESWADGKLTLKNAVGGVYQHIYTSAVGFLTDGVSYEFKLVCLGTSYSFYLDNVRLASGTFGTPGNESRTGGIIIQNLATNDIVLSTHPYPALGIATDREIAPRQGDLLSMPRNCIFYIRNVTLSDAANQLYRPQYVDGSNFISVYFTAGGNFYVVKKLAGVDTNLVAAAAVVSDGDDVCVVLDGTYCKGFVNGVGIASSTNAPYFNSTVFKVENMVNGYQPDAVEIFPRDVTPLLPKELI